MDDSYYEGLGLAYVRQVVCPVLSEPEKGKNIHLREDTFRFPFNRDAPHKQAYFELEGWPGDIEASIQAVISQLWRAGEVGQMINVVVGTGMLRVTVPEAALKNTVHKHFKTGPNPSPMQLQAALSGSGAPAGGLLRQWFARGYGQVAVCVLLVCGVTEGVAWLLA